MACVNIPCASGSKYRNCSRECSLQFFAYEMWIVTRPTQIVGTKNNWMAGVGYQNGNRRTLNALKPQNRNARIYRTVQSAAVTGKPRFHTNTTQQASWFLVNNCQVHRFYHRIFKTENESVIGLRRQSSWHRHWSTVSMRCCYGNSLIRQGSACPGTGR